MKRPSAVRAFTAPMATPLVAVGRMIEQTGNFLLRKTVGSGMIKLDCKVFGLRNVGRQVRKHQRAVRQRDCIAGLVLPGLEVHDFGPADAQHDAQNFHIGYPLCQRSIKTGSTLLDKCEVESRRVGDGLDVCIDGHVGVAEFEFRIVPGNCR